MTHNDSERRLIADIKQLLDAELPDADTRAALQQARIRALNEPGKRQRRPWLEFAVAASLAAVVAVNLPRSKPDDVATPTTAVARAPVSASAVTTAVVPSPAKPTSPSDVTPQAKPVASQAAAVDMDLLENLELYEETEFYEWLSEQESQGGLDA